MSDRIFLRGIQVHARHGVFDEEARLGQRFILDVDYWLDTRACAASDDFRQAVSYGEVHDLAVEIATGSRVALIETLANRIADAVLDRFPPVSSVRVQVHKPSAPIVGIFDDVGVDVTRERGRP
jgi:dihydroneopterin aldolase